MSALETHIIHVRTWNHKYKSSDYDTEVCSEGVAVREHHG